MTMRRWSIFLATAAVVLLLGLRLTRGNGALERGLERLPGLLNERIAVIHLDGEINSSVELIRLLRRYSADVRGVRAIVLAVDSPGGAVAPSQEIYDAIRRLRGEGMIVVVAMGNVAASGAYYLSVAADEIVADPGTLTGSIGVIMESMDLTSLLRKVGVGFEIVKSGEFKDAGGLARPMTARERKMLQGVIDDVHEQFVEAVALDRSEPLKTVLARKRRSATEQIGPAEVKAYVRGLADGRIFSGRQAQALGLVDTLGGLEVAIERAADLAGLDEPEVVTHRDRRSVGEWLTGISREEAKAWFRQNLRTGARIGYYAW